MKLLGTFIALAVIATVSAANAKEWRILQDYQATNDGKARYMIGVEDGRIGIVFMDETAWGSQTTPQQVDQVLETLLNERQYKFAAIARGGRGYLIARRYDDPTQSKAYIADLKQKAFEVDNEIRTRNACVARQLSAGDACTGYVEVAPPTEEEIQRAIQSLERLSD